MNILSAITSAPNFVKNLGKEIIANGKLLSGYIINETTITSLPGIKTAVITAATDKTPAAYIDLSVQILMLAAAILKGKKIVKAAVEVTKIEKNL